MDLTWIDRALGSNIPYITYAVPVFFLLIGVELVVAIWEQKKAYRLHDSINDLSCGITEQMVGLFLKGLLFAGYVGHICLCDQPGYQPGRRAEAIQPAASGSAAIVLFPGCRPGVLLVSSDRA